MEDRSSTMKTARATLEHVVMTVRLKDAFV